MDDPKDKKIKKENTDKLKRHVWKSSEDKILLNILKEQTKHDGKEGTSFTKKAWRDILEQFNESRVDKLEFIAPYRGDRYHIGSFRGSNRRYTSEKDLFNHLHAQLRNVVERTFGVLKARFPILSRKGGIPYPYETQVKIVMACCIIHNFIRKVNQPDELFELYEHGETEENVDHGDQQVRGQTREDDRVAGERVRGGIAQQLWTNHQQRRAQQQEDD